METETPTAALSQLLTALEYGTKKEDREFTKRILARFSLRRSDEPALIKKILAGPGFEKFFLAVAREARPFALMLKEVYGLLSEYGTTAERRAALFRVSGAGARAAFDFDLEAFPKEVLRCLNEIEAAIDILNLQFGSGAEATASFSWPNSQTESRWNAIHPRWDGDFYDDGFFTMLSFGGTVLATAGPDVQARADTIVLPIIDRLSALTDALQWPEFHENEQLEVPNYMNGPLQRLPYQLHQPVQSQLDRAQALTYFQRTLTKRDWQGSSAPPVPVEETIWTKVRYALTSMAIAVDLWARKFQRKDRRSWLEKRMGRVLSEVTPDQYLQQLEPLAQAYRARLDSVLSTVRQQSITQLREALVEFFGLPFWKDRWFLYELWTLCRVLRLARGRWPVDLQGLEHRPDGVTEWKLPGGMATAPVATIGAKGQIECWTQRKTTHPVTRAGLEPDLRLTRATPDHPDVFIVENKDRRKPTKGNIAEILERYVTGTTARCVCLVNYESFTGPTHRLQSSIPGRDVLILSCFQPAREPAQFKQRLMEMLEDEIEPPKGQQATASTPRTDVIEITLKWEHEPNDLDLHAWIERPEGRYYISFRDKGTLDMLPLALLSSDARRAPGRETLTLQAQGLLRATIAVHRFSSGRIGDAVPSIEIEGTTAGPHHLTLTGNGNETWWHVGDIDGTDLSFTPFNVLDTEPP